MIEEFEDETRDAEFQQELDAYVADLRKKEAEELAKQADQENESRKKLALNCVKSVFSERALKKLANGLYMSNMPTRLWREPKILTKILLSMYVYEGYPSVQALIDNLDRRGLATRPWKEATEQRKWSTDILKEAPKRKSTVPHEEGFKRHFEKADSHFQDQYIVMEKSSLPVDLRQIAQNRKAWLNSAIQNNSFTRSEGVNTAVRMLNGYLDQLPVTARILVPWSQYLNMYVCSKPYAVNMHMLKLTADFVRDNCEDSATLNKMPMSSKFRNKYFGNSKFGNGELYWNTHHLDIWSTMVDCVCYSLVGASDPTARIQNWSLQMFTDCRVPKEEAALFQPMLELPMVCYTRPQSSIPPRTQIFAAYPVRMYQQLAALTLGYFNQHKGSYSDKTPLGEKIKKLLLLPVMSACVPESPHETLLFGNFYSNLRLW